MTAPYDTIIIGAGMSGIGSAALLRRNRPDDSFLILDALPGPGGTWATHRYPGIRSDSSTYTYGFTFKPWPGHDTATGPAIRDYLDAIIADHALAPHIRHDHRVTHADWSEATHLWTLTVTTPEGEARFTARFLWLCQGYYDHAQGFTPDWPGMADFLGPHPASADMAR